MNTDPLSPSDTSQPRTNPAAYYAHACGEPYRREPFWLDSFAAVAERILNDLQPSTVLDAGCGIGLLVEALRQRGISAWGIDPSADAIEDIPPEIKRFCQIGSLADPFPQPHYDLVVCAEAVAGLPLQTAESIIANLCQHADQVLFSSASFSPSETAPEGGKTPDQWTALFLHHAFVHDVDFDASFITPWAVLLRRTPLPPEQALQQMVNVYARKLWQLHQESDIRRERNISQKQELVQRALIHQQEMQEKNSLIAAREVEIQYQKQVVEAVKAERDAILNSTSWRFISRIQRLRERLIPIGSQREAALRFMIQAPQRVRSEGLRALFRFQPAVPPPPPPVPLLEPPPGVEIINIEPVPAHPPAITEGEADERLLQGWQASKRHMPLRQDWIQRGHEHFAGKRILFVLPIAAAGGGANLILLAARAMRKMGVDVQIYNLNPYRSGFEQAYPSLNIPVIYGEIAELPEIAIRFDAAVATSYITVYWLAPAASRRPDLLIAYYIQDYEPYFELPGSEEYQKAAASYTLLPGLVRCCTTQWIADEILRLHPVAEQTTSQKEHIPVLGPSLDCDLFLPRPRRWQAGSQPLRIAAMIRPSTARRNPRLTMEVMQRASQEFGNRAELILFGADLPELVEAQLPLTFPFKLTGRLKPEQVASLMNEVDIFVDYSTFQGLGLTALEAMACGVATVVPQQGGTASFAQHEENSLIVDTRDEEACFAALQRLVNDDQLRLKFQKNGILQAAHFYPEQPAFRLLAALFPADAQGGA
ncbi:MAG: glycosyltransferase [Anaerolineales bacterium]|nr:glycosyltransferase [Anaerolineales bacterium]